MRHMGLLSDTTKCILILSGVIGVFLILELLKMNQTALAILIIIELIVPIATVAPQYQKSFRELKCNHRIYVFTVSPIRLLSTVKFAGTSPPSETVAYDLKCPKCNSRDWGVPIE